MAAGQARSSALLTATLLCLLASLRPAVCVSQLDDDLLPSAQDTAECCLTRSAISSRFLQDSSATFSEAARYCSTMYPPRTHTILAGFRRAGTGERPVFGCGSAVVPACDRRPLDSCSLTCLYRQTCFVRALTGQGFLARESERSSGSTSEGASINTTETLRSADTSVLSDGAVETRTIDEVINEDRDINVDEMTKSESDSLTVNTGQLLQFGRRILESPAGQPTGALTTNLSSITAGSGAGAGGPVCCVAHSSMVPQPEAGVSSLDQCQQRCQTLKFSLAVHIAESSWGCANQRLRLYCQRQKTCDGCLETPSCLTLYSFGVVEVETVQSSRRTVDQFNVDSAETENSRDVLARTLSVGVDRLRVRDVTTTTNVTDQGQKSGQQLISIGTNVAITSGDGTQRTSLSQDSVSVGTGASTGRRTVSHVVSISDQQATQRNISAGGARGTSDDSSSKDTTVRLIHSISNREVGRNTTLDQSQTGDALDTGYRQIDLLGGRPGNASLTASQLSGARTGDTFLFRSSFDTRRGRDDIHTAGGGIRQELRAGITIISEAVQSRSDNGSTATSTGFDSDDPALGSLRVNRSRTEEGADVRTDTRTDTSISDERTTVEQCPGCGPTTRTEDASERVIQARSSTQTSLGALTTRSDQDAAAHNVSSIGVDTVSRAEQQVTTTTGSQQEDSRQTTLVSTQGDTFENNRLDDKRQRKETQTDTRENQTKTSSTLVIHRGPDQ